MSNSIFWENKNTSKCHLLKFLMNTLSDKGDLTALKEIYANLEYLPISLFDFKGLLTIDEFSIILFRKDNFYDFLFAFLFTKPLAGFCGSVGCAIRSETRLRVQPPPRLATFFRGD